MQHSELLKVLIPLMSIFFGAFLTWSGTYFFQRRSQIFEQKRLLSVLFGELLNIRQHYFYASAELPSSITSRRSVLALKMALYGKFAIEGKDLPSLGFLTDKDIAEIMQLMLKVRNTDFSIELSLEYSDKRGRPIEFTAADQAIIKRRMSYVIDVVEALILGIAKRNPPLRKLVPTDLIGT